MKFNKSIRNLLLILFATFALSACSTAKKSSTSGDVYTGKETVKYLASGVADRVFFATNRSTLTTASRATLRKQADYLRKNKKLNSLKNKNVLFSAINCKDVYEIGLNFLKENTSYFMKKKIFVKFQEKKINFY